MTLGLAHHYQLPPLTPTITILNSRNHHRDHSANYYNQLSSLLDNYQSSLAATIIYKTASIMIRNHHFLSLSFTTTNYLYQPPLPATTNSYL